MKILIVVRFRPNNNAIDHGKMSEFSARRATSTPCDREFLQMFTKMKPLNQINRTFNFVGIVLQLINLSLELNARNRGENVVHDPLFWKELIFINKAV